MQKINFLFLNLILFVLFAGSSSAECNPHLRVGLILGLSGEAASWGLSNKNGFEMGLENAGCQPLVRFYEDDQFDPKRSVAALRKLIDSSQINLILTGSSAVANALAPIVEQKKIVQVAWVSDTKVTEGRSYSIRMWNSGATEGRVLAEAAFKKGYRKLALFTQLHDYSQSVKAGIIAAGQGSNSPLEIALDEDFPLDAKDFRSAILKLKSKQVDALGICPAVPGAAGLMVKQVRQMGLTVPIFGCESVELEGNFEISEGHLAGVWFSTIAVDPKFAEKFIRLHGEPGTMPGAAVFYDLATMLSRTKSSGAELVAEILNGPSFLGVSGVWKPTKTPTDQYLDIPIAILRYTQDGTQVEGW